MLAASREETAFAAAEKQFQDGFWNRAEALLAQFIHQHPASTNAPQAVLLQAQAEFKQGKFAEAATLLANKQGAAGSLADEYLRWQGEAQFQAGQYAAAAETFSTLAANFPNSPLNLTAVVGAAAAWEKLGVAEAARVEAWLTAPGGVFARRAQAEPEHPQIIAGRLLLAQSKFLRNDLAGADAVLDLLAPPLRGEQDFQWWHLRGQVKAARNDFDAALVAATNLVALARRQNDPGWLAESVAWQADLLEKLHRRPEAILIWQENLTAGPENRVQEAYLKIAALAAESGQFTVAETMLDQFRAKFPQAREAGLALLTTGELRLREAARSPTATNQLALALATFDELLAADPNSPLAGRAFLQRGWARWLAGDTNAGWADFLAAAQRLPTSEDLAVAKFKVGDAQFGRGNFSEARNYYQSVLKDFADFPAVAKSLASRALYQILRADLKLNDLAGAEAAMRQLLEKYPASEVADNSLLLVGEANTDFGRPAKALELFQDFEKQFPDSPLQPRVRLAAARTFERLPDWPAAVTNYVAWLQAYPTNELQPQVKYALALAQFHAGHEANAFALFTSFIAEFPTNALAPLAQWWVADHFFRATNFSGAENFLMAETNYENIFQNPAWKDSEVFYPAQLMAGRAAMARLGFSDAVRSYFTPLLSDTNCPPELAVQARFACAHALMQAEVADTNKLAANYQSALALLEQVCQLNPTNEWAARAGSEIADGQLQLGDWAAATNAYNRVLELPAADRGLKARARVGLGLTLEKMAALLPPADRKPLQQSALYHYCDVLYDETGDAFWAKKAGLQALPLMQATGEGNVNQVIDRLESLLPQLKTSLEEKRAALTARKE